MSKNSPAQITARSIRHLAIREQIINSKSSIISHLFSPANCLSLREGRGYVYPSSLSQRRHAHRTTSQFSNRMPSRMHRKNDGNTDFFLHRFVGLRSDFIGQKPPVPAAEVRPAHIWWSRHAPISYIVVSVMGRAAKSRLQR